MNTPITNNNTASTFPFFVTGYSAATAQSDSFNQQNFIQDSNHTSNLTVNDWLNQLMVHPDLKQQQQNEPTTDFNDLFQFLPISPPLTTSPDSVHQDMVPSTINTPTMNNVNAASNDPLVALFPDILNNHLPPPRPVVTQRKAPVAIMPKGSNMVPIAPRPGGFTPPVTISKRKSDASGIDQSDEAAQKRQKNTDAARRSRLKKIIKMETLEKQVTELESDNARLTTRVAVLESEKSALVLKDKGLEERIRVLEAQLAEAHHALTATVNATQNTTTTTTITTINTEEAETDSA
ncbi:hypothetical protein BD560DRAFT_398237 [Blakeslea trispora]|nr:hypothetical protein BD560DRAFT_398237 [Blakeslea trispora]